MVKNPPAIRETWLRSLVREDPLEEGMTNRSSILAWRIPMDGGAWWATVQVTKNWTRLKRLSTEHSNAHLTWWLWELKAMIIWASCESADPEVLHFQQVPRCWWCYRSIHHTLKCVCCCSGMSNSLQPHRLAFKAPLSMGCTPPPPQPDAY